MSFLHPPLRNAIHLAAYVILDCPPGKVEIAINPESSVLWIDVDADVKTPRVYALRRVVTFMLPAGYPFEIATGIRSSRSATTDPHPHEEPPR